MTPSAIDQAVEAIRKAKGRAHSEVLRWDLEIALLVGLDSGLLEQIVAMAREKEECLCERCYGARDIGELIYPDAASIRAALVKEEP